MRNVACFFVQVRVTSCPNRAKSGHYTEQTFIFANIHVIYISTYIKMHLTIAVYDDRVLTIEVTLKLDVKL